MNPQESDAEATVYVDALNFYYSVVRKTDCKWLDIAAWVQSLVPHHRVKRVRYFTARIKQRSSEDKARDRQNIYLRALEANPLMDVRYGHFRSEPRWKALAERDVKDLVDLFRPALIPTTDAAAVLARSASERTEYLQEALVTIDEEKGSDVNLGVHLVHDALTGECGATALLITNDSDLEEAVRLAAGHTDVVLVHPTDRPPNGRLVRHVSGEIVFDRVNLRHFLLPNTVRAANGRDIQCPREWRQKP